MANEPPWPGREQLITDMILKAPETATQRELKAWLADGDTAERRRSFIEHAFEKYVDVIAGAMRKHDPNHLNLGMRFAGDPSPAMIRASKRFDVYSLNAYDYAPNPARLQRIYDATGLPMLIGEFHIGTPGRGMAPGLRQARSEAERGVAYRYYVENAAAFPAMIGTHWFEWLDEPVTGRMDGENYNIGMVDVTDIPYPRSSGGRAGGASPAVRRAFRERAAERPEAGSAIELSYKLPYACIREKSNCSRGGRFQRDRTRHGHSICPRRRARDCVGPPPGAARRATEGVPVNRGVAADAAKAGDMEKLAQHVLAQHGRIDILVYSAGTNIPDRSLKRLNAELWDMMVSVNLNSAYYITRAVLPAMREKGAGHLIYVSSISGLVPDVSGASYQAAKRGPAGTGACHSRGRKRKRHSHLRDLSGAGGYRNSGAAAGKDGAGGGSQGPPAGGYRRGRAGRGTTPRACRRPGDASGAHVPVGSLRSRWIWAFK